LLGWEDSKRIPGLGATLCFILAPSIKGQTFDFLAFLLHHKAPSLASIRSLTYFPTTDCLVVVAHCIDRHAPIPLHLAHIAQTVQYLNPAVWIHQCRHGWTCWQIGKCHARWSIAARLTLMWAFLIVVLPKGRRNQDRAQTITFRFVMPKSVRRLSGCSSIVARLASL
jgi:hypothetical protein